MARRSQVKFDSSNVHFEGQGSYHNDPCIIRRTTYNRNSRSGKPSNKFNVEFFNCKCPDHLIKGCKEQINVAEAATRQFKFYKPKDQSSHSVKMVLAELFRQLDYQDSFNSEKFDASDDVKVFKSLLGSENNASINRTARVDDDKIWTSEEIFICVPPIEWDSEPQLKIHFRGLLSTLGLNGLSSVSKWPTYTQIDRHES